VIDGCPHTAAERARAVNPDVPFLFPVRPENCRLCERERDESAAAVEERVRQERVRRERQRYADVIVEGY
jgi:hypothetical protein